MGDACQENDNSKGKAAAYKTWTIDESNELLNLMVDAAKRGWRDSNGLFTKLFNSGFGWDPVTKKFTAPNEVWEEYFKVHHSHKSYRTDTFGDYDDLRIAVGNGTAIGKNAIGLGDDTDARTYDDEASKKHQPLDDLVYDNNTETYTHDTLDDFQDPLAQPSESINLDGSPPPAPKKRNRSEFERNSSSCANASQPDAIMQISHSVEKMVEAVKSFNNDDCSCWDLIKDLPDLDQLARFKALKLLNTRAKKMEFVKMTPEERYAWIIFELDM
ncbi:Dihydrolipoamide acetyltransferase [Heracleum sosnowskyi]|uniref:Dihydrolipoamide acetyltransferase n=1 Tax=Heracleum sosnowskyi TaxID=360622 RepID=A0AAD8JEK8_9APIA|nr:Dihydrolipoamide acetyltransferase [Heracleum sosnowskyi]